MLYLKALIYKFYQLIKFYWSISIKLYKYSDYLFNDLFIDFLIKDFFFAISFKIKYIKFDRITA